MSYKMKLPNLEGPERQKNQVEEVLNSVRDQIDATYFEKISVLITTSSTFNRDEERVLSYALHLMFIRHSNFSYRLMEVNCIKPDGGFPVQVNAFSGPSESFGEAKDGDELSRKVEDVFNHPRTRNIILSNY